MERFDLVIKKRSFGHRRFQGHSGAVRVFQNLRPGNLVLTCGENLELTS